MMLRRAGSDPDPELFRTVAVGRVLARRGAVFRSREEWHGGRGYGALAPFGRPEAAADALYDQSAPSTRADAFVSHAWADDARLKYLALCYRSSSRPPSPRRASRGCASCSACSRPGGGTSRPTAARGSCTVWSWRSPASRRQGSSRRCSAATRSASAAKGGGSTSSASTSRTRPSRARPSGRCRRSSAGATASWCSAANGTLSGSGAASSWRRSSRSGPWSTSTSCRSGWRRGSSRRWLWTSSVASSRTPS
mmetsp:Transcript_21260/g.63473  ORF Transcript_21260/g.63473 Transcript_21260/m.63473 type:complete len:252 (-) Transcript_21260:309-1064(-)